MTDRIKGLVVTLDKDYREDDVEAIVGAIRMIKGVANVHLNVTDMDDHINRQRIRAELVEKLFEVLKE